MYALFSGVSPADRAAIISAGREKQLSRRQTLFSLGDPVDQVFLLLSGSVKITQVGIKGDEVILRLSGIGELIGMFGPSPECNHSSSAQTLQAGAALVWDAGTFTKLLDHVPVFRRNTVRALEERLQEMEQRFRELSTEDVPSRLSSELIRLSNRFAYGDKENGDIHLSQTDLAQLTGTTLSTVSRLLSRWEKLGIVSVRRETVRVHNVTALSELSQTE